MTNSNLKQIKQLYYSYSPLKTNIQLKSEYQKITKKNIQCENEIRSIYNFQIKNGFLNETVIKSAFIERFSFKKSPEKNVTIFELNAGKSRADLCVINGKSMVFEIKTEFDTFNRLENQLSDYAKYFEYIYLIIPEEKVQIVLKSLEKKVGIISYRKNRLGNIVFKENQSPLLNEGIDPKEQLSQLTKKQLCSIIEPSNLSKERLINFVRTLKTPEEINELYKKLIKQKYFYKWNFVFSNRNQISPLDYQWFFKNNLEMSIVYK